MDELNQTIPDPASGVHPENQSVAAPAKPGLSLKPIHIALTLIAGIILGIGGLFGYQEYIASPPVTNYDQCTQADGSQLTVSYPGVCVTRDGKQFTQTLTEQELKNLKPPADSSDWATYTNPVRNYVIRYPDDWTIDTSKAETSPEDVAGAVLTFRKGGYLLSMTWPSAYGPGICIFDDQSRANAPEMANYCEGEYVEFIDMDDNTTYRRLVLPEEFNDHTQWEIYSLQNEYFTTTPPIRYRGPLDYDTSVIQLMDQILGTFSAY